MAVSPSTPLAAYIQAIETFEEIDQNRKDSAISYPNRPTQSEVKAQDLILVDNLKGLESYLQPKNWKGTKTQKAEEMQERVNSMWNRCNIRPLHVAAILGNFRAAAMLLATGVCKLNKVDDGGATPLHHATIRGHRALMNLLIENNARLKSTLRGADPELIYKLSYSTQAPNSQKDDFKRLTGANLLEDECYVAPLEWVKRWEKCCWSVYPPPKTVESDQNNALHKLHADYKSSPVPKTYLKHDPQLGYYLCAGESIPKHRVIGEYLGEIITFETAIGIHKSSEESKENMSQLENADLDEESLCYATTSEAHYLFAGDRIRYVNKQGQIKSEEENIIDARIYRNETAMINCSFPNVMTRNLHTESPFKRRVLFITMEDIEKDTPFALEYGHHDVKCMAYREMREEALMHYFKTKGEDNLLSDFSKMLADDTQADNQSLEEAAELAKMLYLITTPTALLTLILNDILSFETVKELFKLNLAFTLASRYCFRELKQLYKHNRLTSEHKKELLAAIGHKKLLDIFRMLKAINLRAQQSESMVG